MAEPMEVTLPCRVGDDVWGISRRGGHTLIVSGIVHQMYFIDDMQLVITIRGACKGEWGKHIFPTYDAAKAAIDEEQRE